MNRNHRMSKKDKLNWLADIADGLRPLDARASKLVLRLLDDPDAQVRAEAVSCLWHTADPMWIEELLTKSQRDPDLDVRTRAISTLGHYIVDAEIELFSDLDNDERALSESDIQRVVDFLFDTAQNTLLSVDERRYSIEALAFLDDPEVDELIHWAYSQNDPRYRASAIFAMGRSGNLRWSDEVLMEMHSANRDVQYEAVRAAGELGLQEATEDLIRLVRGRGVEKALRLRAIYSLGEAGDDRAYPVLEELCHARDREVREAAREAAEEWLMSSMADRIELEQDEEAIWMEPEASQVSGYPRNMWDNVIGTFSLN
ncbi:MAG: HEAT repeat domain-containing protein [Chloroflexota bacterium]|nr:MAG: HEAT repeat domain-containing protein [Chloroflexota bacterium]